MSCQLSCTSMEYCQKHLLRLWNSISTTSSLWSGQSTSKGEHQVSWEKFYLPKRKSIGTNQTYLESLHKSWVSLDCLGLSKFEGKWEYFKMRSQIRQRGRVLGQSIHVLMKFAKVIKRQLPQLQSIRPVAFCSSVINLHVAFCCSIVSLFVLTRVRWWSIVCCNDQMVGSWSV